MKDRRHHLQSAEVLILTDGKILAHNITPEMAAVLAELQPDNVAMQQRRDINHSTTKIQSPKI